MRARLLAQPNGALKISRTEQDLVIEVPATAPDVADTVIALECAIEPKTDLARLLVTNIGANTLRGFDATLKGSLRFGSGEKSNDTVQNWITTNDAVVWPVRVNETATFDLAINYDAPRVSKTRRLVEGDAGKEIAPVHQGASGVYIVQFGGNAFSGTVRQGNQVVEALGRVALSPGNYEIRVAAKEI